MLYSLNFVMCGPSWSSGDGLIADRFSSSNISFGQDDALILQLRQGRTGSVNGEVCLPPGYWPLN
ncbi:MAG: hypothetical protein ACK4UZ_05000, partial [Rhizobium rhizophilum]